MTASFLELTTAHNKTLMLTPEHHLPVGSMCCSEILKAKEISVGMTVWITVEEKKLASVRITDKSVVDGVGLHSPVLINGGFPIVDGFVTSFDSIEKVTLARNGLSSLIHACKATGSCELFRDMFLGNDGKHIELNADP
jgi:hypothetical protein